MDVDEYESLRSAQRGRGEAVSVVGLGVGALLLVVLGYAVRLGALLWLLDLVGW